MKSFSLVLNIILALNFATGAFGQIIEVQSPNGKEIWARGETHEIKWDPAGWTTLHVYIVLKNSTGIE